VLFLIGSKNMNESKDLTAHKLDWSTSEKLQESLLKRGRLENAVEQANLEAAMVERKLWTLEEHKKFTWFQDCERV